MSKQKTFSNSVSAVFLSAEEDGKLSAKARQKLMEAITSDNLTEEEYHLVNLILYSVRVGRLSMD